MLLGFTEQEVQEKTEEIIAFSEIGEFIDVPVRTYSSGMYSKLAFSITAILETDIMLVDEVLSVGDSRFKKKSYKKRTVILVSHAMETLGDLCDEILWLHEGQVRMYGKAKEVLTAYEEFMK